MSGKRAWSRKEPTTAHSQLREKFAIFSPLIPGFVPYFLQNFMLIHVSLVPCIGTTGEHKTKPTQHSIRELRGLGLSPDVVSSLRGERSGRMHPRAAHD